MAFGLRSCLVSHEIVDNVSLHLTPNINCTIYTMSRHSDYSRMWKKAMCTLPLPQAEGVPEPSGNSGLQGESVPVDGGHGPNCRRIPGKAHVC